MISLKFEAFAGLSEEYIELLFLIVMDESAHPAVPILLSLSSELPSASLLSLWNPNVRLVMPWEPLPSKGYRGAVIVTDED